MKSKKLTNYKGIKSIHDRSLAIRLITTIKLYVRKNLKKYRETLVIFRALFLNKSCYLVIQM